MTLPKRLLLYVSVFMMFIGFCQKQQPNNPTLQELAFLVDVNASKYANAIGSKYLFDEFKLAKIEGFQGSHLIRFDAVDNIIELKKEADEIRQLSKKKQYKIEFLDGSGTYETKSFTNSSGKIEYSFFEKRYECSKFLVYKKERIKFEPAKPAKSSYEQEVPAEFVNQANAYYLLKLSENNPHLVEIPRKKKALLAFFGNKSKEMAAFLKKQKLKPNSEEDIIKIIHRYLD